MKVEVLMVVAYSMEECKVELNLKMQQYQQQLVKQWM
jgi:hypothetical protein